MNSWSITGNLGQDPKLNTLQSGDQVLNLSVAVKHRVKKNGEWVDEPIWVGVTLFGKRAESLAKMLQKGSRVGAVGELNVREYETRDGTRRTAIELIARDVEPLDGKRDGNGEQRTQSRQQLSHDDHADDGDSDIPF
jgi:single-strand DNA-binding protein